MQRETVKLLLALGAMLIGLGAMWFQRPVSHPPGILVSEEPRQEELAVGPVIELAGFALTPRAEFVVEARVLSAESYRFDGGARLSPVDLALGWGPMSDSALLERFRITQGARFYTLYPQDETVDVALALRHSANMHLIPADDDVRDIIESTRTGHVISLRGVLVDAAGPDGFRWRTSLTREDTGAGACELFLVEAAAIL